MAARRPYKTHRQQHLGDFLDVLQAQGWLVWERATEDSPTVFLIREIGSPPRQYRTWDAETVAQRVADREGILWLPVPYPGGLDQYKETMAQIAVLASRKQSTSAPGT